MENMEFIIIVIFVLKCQFIFQVIPFPKDFKHPAASTVSGRRSIHLDQFLPDSSRENRKLSKLKYLLSRWHFLHACSKITLNFLSSLINLTTLLILEMLFSHKLIHFQGILVSCQRRRTNTTSTIPSRCSHGTWNPSPCQKNQHPSSRRCCLRCLNEQSN